jgi:hypothetical protein
VAARRRWVWVSAAVLAAAAVGVVVTVMATGGRNGDEPDGEEPAPATVGLESDVRFEIITASCGYEVVVTAQVTVDPQNGQFCLVRFDARNRGDIPHSFDASCQFLIDTAGTRHRQREDLLPLDEVTLEFFEEELLPQTQAHDIGLYYDVPEGIEAAGMEVHTTCGSPGVLLEATA